MRTRVALGLVALAVCSACAPVRPPTGQVAQPPQAGAGAPKVLTVAITEDPGNFWDALTGGGGSGSRELGQMVGVTREKINRALEQFEQRGVLTNGRQGITIQRPELLRQCVA